jgi:hypothetical protein
MKWILLTLALSLPAYAQNVRVTKVSGKKAIVVRESGPPLKVGMLLTGGGDEFNESDLDSNVASSGRSSKSVGPRNNTIGGSAKLASTSTSSSGGGSKSTFTDIALTGFYGWNKKTMEYGPRFTLARSSSKVGNTSSSSTTFGLGAFFDYNFSPNVPGKEMLYALGATFDYLSSSTSGGGKSTSTMDFFVGPGLKWFPLGNSVAVRGDAGLEYARSGSGSTTTTGTTFLVRGGLQVYF